MPLSAEEIWENAVPLSEAWLKFIDYSWPDPRRSRIYEILLEPALPGEFTGQPGMTWDHYNPKSLAQRLREREVMPVKFANEVFHTVHSGRLNAYGKPWLPDAREEIVRLPGEMFLWDAEVKPTLVGDQISSLGRSYVQVRIASPEMIAQLEGPGVRPRGRTSYKPEIEIAVRHFLGQDARWYKRRRKIRRADIIGYCQREFEHVPKGRDPDNFSLTVCDDVISLVLKNFKGIPSRKLPT